MPSMQVRDKFRRFRQRNRGPYFIYICTCRLHATRMIYTGNDVLRELGGADGASWHCLDREEQLGYQGVWTLHHPGLCVLRQKRRQPSDGFIRGACVVVSVLLLCCPAFWSFWYLCCCLEGVYFACTDRSVLGCCFPDRTAKLCRRHTVNEPLDCFSVGYVRISYIPVYFAKPGTRSSFVFYEALVDNVR